MDWPLEKTSVVIVGAGFSVAATDGKMPLMRNYFDGLSQTDYPSLWSFVCDVASGVCDANVEHVLLALDQVRTSPDAVLDGWGRDWKQNVPRIQQELSAYTLRRLRDCMQIEPDNWAVKTLIGCGTGTTVISMNYDNIAERILSNREGTRHGPRGNCPHCKMRRILELGCSCSGRSEISAKDWTGAVIKPHGSVSWKRCLNRACCSYECLVADEQCKPFEACRCPSCHQDCGPVMVMPTMSKNLSDIPEIGIMWQAARQAIANAESILFFGFSLPTSDELLLQMIRSSIRQNHKLKRVACIDLNPKGVLDRFERCVPVDDTVDAVSFVVERGKVPDWIEDVVAAPSH